MGKHPHETLPEYTQFARFAQALWQELLAVKGGYIEIGKHDIALEYTDILARRAYDLVAHTVYSIGPDDLDRLTSEECVQRIPDLTTFADDGQ